MGMSRNRDARNLFIINNISKLRYFETFPNIACASVHFFAPSQVGAKSPF